MIGDYDASVRRKVADLQQKDLRALEAAVIEKRLRWCRDHLAPSPEPITPR